MLSVNAWNSLFLIALAIIKHPLCLKAEVSKTLVSTSNIDYTTTAAPFCEGEDIGVAFFTLRLVQANR